MSKEYTVEIPLKLPSLNEYINVCRTNKYAAASFKREQEESLMWFLKKLPKFQHPVSIHFHWVEKNQKRDIDNIAFAKKFILDALVKLGKLKDDNQQYVKSFTDTFEISNVTKVILYIKETDDEFKENL